MGLEPGSVLKSRQKWNPPVIKTEGFILPCPFLLLYCFIYCSQDRPSYITGTYAAFRFHPAEAITSTAGNYTAHDSVRLNPHAALHRFTTLRQHPNFQTKQHQCPAPSAVRYTLHCALQAAGQLCNPTILAIPSTQANFF